MKKCTKCEGSLDLGSFYKNSSTLDGLSSWCKKCTNEASKGRYVLKLKRSAEKADHKVCARCRSEKPFSEFRANPKLKCGLQSWCRSCESAYESERNNSQYAQDPHFRWKTQERQKLRDVIYRSGLLKDSFAEEFEKVLGCSVEQFRTYVEARFQPGMNWGNYGKGKGRWQFDHVKAVMKSEVGDNVNHYSNLQPLWHEDNSRKGSR